MPPSQTSVTVFRRTIPSADRTSRLSGPGSWVLPAPPLSPTSPAMDIAAFDFALPPDRIAQHPARPRDAARLLAIGEQRRDRLVRDLPSLLHPGDMLVANDTRVIPAQLAARRGAARIGITLDRHARRHLARPGSQRAPPARGRRAAFDGAGSDARRAGARRRTAASRWRSTARRRLRRRAACGRRARLAALHRPARRAERQDATRLPDHLRRARRRRRRAHRRPALHPALLDALDARGVAARTSHCMSAPAPSCRCATDDVAEHRMHAERGEITEAAAAQRSTRRAPRGGRVVAVGTTSLRLLETAADRGRRAARRSPAKPTCSSCPATASASWTCC